MSASDPDAISAEVVEAEIRRLMAKHAGVADRGWSTCRERASLHRRIDDLLDEWLIWRDVEGLDDELAAS